MNSSRDECGVDGLLRDLPRADPDIVRTARIRERCLKTLNRRTARRPIESALVGGFCAVYLAGIALLALQMLSTVL